MSPLVPLAIGFGFGACLQRAGLARYDVIVNVFRFRDLAVLEFLMSALVTSSLGIALLSSLGLAAPLPLPVTYIAGNLLGGVVFGAGMALSGFCPGTIAAGAGEGRLDTLVAGGAGLFAGALAYGALFDVVMPALTKLGRIGAVTLVDLVHAEPWLLVAVFVETAAIVLYLVAARGRSPRRPA